MKRIVMSLVWLFATGGLVVAQTELSNFVQEGRATWEVAGIGLQASHPSLPIGSTPTIRNIATGKEIAVTVTGRIPVSTERVIDISNDAAMAIGLEPGGSVLVHFPSPTVAEPSSEFQSSVQGINIIIHNHVIPRSAWQARDSMEAGATFAPNVIPDPPRPAVRVFPDMPDPHSGRVYRLQVGSWPNLNNAFAAFLQLRDADFSTVHEYAHGMYNVYASSIPSFGVYYAIQRLGDMGFMEIYVREQ